jgi:LysR family cyn operon transcriptional activator
MVRLGQVATILPDTIALYQHRLNSLELLPELPHHTVSLICRRDKKKSPACQAFGSLVLEWSQARSRLEPGQRFRPCQLNGDNKEAAKSDDIPSEGRVVGG